MPCVFSDPIFSHVLVCCLYHAGEVKQLLLLLEGVLQWLISYGRQKQQHLHGQWLPTELGLSLLARGILFEGKRRKSTVMLPSTMPSPPSNNVNRKAIISFKLSKQKVHSGLCLMLGLVQTQTFHRGNQHSTELFETSGSLWQVFFHTRH